MSSTVLFSLIAIALVAVALGFVLPTLMRSRVRRQESARAGIEADIYRRELEELQDDAVRGDIAPEDVQAAREELRRRRADEVRRAPAPEAPRYTRTAAIIVAIALPLVATGLYLTVGRPGALDEHATPLDAGEGDYVTRLQSHLSRQPRDGRGWVLLARAQADQNQFKDAAMSYEKALTVSEKIGKDPGVLCEYADVLGMAQGGSLGGRPTELVAQALAINPKHPVALEMAGSAAYAEGRYAEAARYWKELADTTPADSERHRELVAAIERAQRRAAVSLPR